jgi:hypothetical protein
MGGLKQVVHSGNGCLIVLREQDQPLNGYLIILTAF